MAKKKSASQQAAELEYFKANNISFEVNAEKKARPSKNKIVFKPSPPGIKYGLGSVKDHGIYISLINKCQPLIYMEDKEIVTNLLKDYSQALKLISRPELRHLFLVKQYLYSQSMHSGICFYARQAYSVRIVGCSWINESSEVENYWCSIPRDLYTTDEVIKSMQFRVNRLTQILKSMQDE